MANFPLRFGAGAGYAANDPVSSAELNAVDGDHVKTANFTDGSAHSPAANIELTGPFGLKLMGTQKLLYAARQLSRYVNLLVPDGTVDGVSWAWNNVVLRHLVSAATIQVYFEPPHGSVLNEVICRWDGAAGHAADPVGCTMPLFSVCRTDIAGSLVAIGGVTDTVTNRALYEAEHSLTYTGIAHTVDRSLYRYSVVFTGEAAPDYKANGELRSILVKCTLSSQQEW